MENQSNLPCIFGLGERSTKYYIHMLHKKYHAKFGDYHTFPFILYQIDFNTINPFLPNQFEKLVPILTKYINKISKFETSHYLIPNITLHESFDKIDHKLNLVHPIQLSIDYCKANNIRTIVLLGSLYTMTTNYISDAFKLVGIETIQPSDKEKIIIDNFRKKVYNSNETHSDFSAYQNIILKYSNTNHIVTACTELSIYHNQLKNLKVIDMALLQMDSILALMTENS